MGTKALYDTTKGKVMGKLDGKVAVITGGSSGMVSTRPPVAMIFASLPNPILM